MTVTSSEILNTARICISANDESGYRSAVSRAYYSMLHEAMSSLHSLPNFSRDHHKNTVGYLTTPAECKIEPYPTGSLKSLGWALKQWRDARNEADYDLNNVSLSVENAEEAIEAAEIFFQKWADLKSAKAS